MDFMVCSMGWVWPVAPGSGWVRWGVNSECRAKGPRGTSSVMGVVLGWGLSPTGYGLSSDFRL